MGRSFAPKIGQVNRVMQPSPTRLIHGVAGLVGHGRHLEAASRKGHHFWHEGHSVEFTKLVQRAQNLRKFSYNNPVADMRVKCIHGFLF